MDMCCRVNMLLPHGWVPQVFLGAGSSPPHRYSWVNPFFPLVEMSRMYEGCSEETPPLSPMYVL